VLETDATKARTAARRGIAFNLDLPNYRRNLQRFGMRDEDFADGGSNRLVHSVVAWGDERAIRARIQAHYDAGANHVCIQPINPDGTPTPDWRVLEALAPARSA
jgi:hypothetical protein